MKHVYTFWGKVLGGNKRGKTLGFPTANIPLHKKIPEGIYISDAKIKGNYYPALTFIGRAITFGENELKSETYLLKNSQNLYGVFVSIRLHKKIRENKKFKSAEE